MWIKKTKREEVHELLTDIYKKIPGGARDRILTAIKNGEEFSLWF